MIDGIPNQPLYFFFPKGHCFFHPSLGMFNKLFLWKIAMSKDIQSNQLGQERIPSMVHFSRGEALPRDKMIEVGCKPIQLYPGLQRGNTMGKYTKFAHGGPPLSPLRITSAQPDILLDDSCAAVLGGRADIDFDKIPESKRNLDGAPKTCAREVLVKLRERPVKTTLRTREMLSLPVKN